MGWDDAPPTTQELSTSSWDSTPPTKQEMQGPQWSDLPKNIGPDAMNVGKGNLETAERIGKGVMDLPTDAIQSGIGAFSGQKLSETPLGQDVQTTAKGIGNAVGNIIPSVENLGSKAEWVQHPVQNAITAGGLLEGGAEGLLKAPEKSVVGSLGESIKERGQVQAANLSEISGDTVKKMNPRLFSPEAQQRIRMAGSTPNVADIRNEIGNKLTQDKVVGGYGQDIGDRLQAISEKKESAGNNVKGALEAIRSANKKMGEYSDVDDSLHVQSNPILQPIIDQANALKNSGKRTMIQSSRLWRETYNSLANKAEANGGRLSFDDIKSEMHDAGEEMEASVNSSRYQTAKKVYAHLAGIKDQMVNDIASRTGDKTLAKNLLDANREFTFYSKIEDDTRNAAAGGEEPENMGKHLARASIRGNPAEATGYLGLINVLNSVEPALAPKLIKAGGLIEKYGPTLAAAAKKGVRNLALTSHLISQNDPAYREALSD